jgi:response regulator RpfG family c-di-GMP phosphodiesterase
LVVRLSVLYQEKLNIAAIKQEKTEEKMLSSLNALSMARDNETGNHIIRTQHYVKLLALRLRAMGLYQGELSDPEIELLFRAAPLHDIGKVGIPDAILLKPGRLDKEEWSVMKTHTIIGESVLSSAEVEIQSDEDVIAIAIQIAGGHHEKWDGSGYPRNLRGNEIPLSARIMALADMYDALVSERIYKKEWTHEEAANEITSKRGAHFDPVVVDAFIAEIDSFKEIAQKYRDH